MSTHEPTSTVDDQHVLDLEASRRTAQHDRDDARVDRERAAAHLARVYRDDLTGALTRRPGRECLDREIHRAHAAHTPLTVAFTDVDGLKRVNDRHGHADGDRLLHAVGAALLDNLRPYDLVIRYGGDEFVCALIDSARPSAEQSMQRVQQQLARHDPLIGLSVGYAELRDDDTLDRLLERADSDMYQDRQRKPDESSGGVEGRPAVSCLHCAQRMDLQLDATASAPVRDYTATCPTCRRSVRLTVPQPRSRFTGDHAVAPVITLPDRT